MKVAVAYKWKGEIVCIETSKVSPVAAAQEIKKFIEELEKK